MQLTAGRAELYVLSKGRFCGDLIVLFKCAPKKLDLLLIGKIGKIMTFYQASKSFVLFSFFLVSLASFPSFTIKF